MAHGLEGIRIPEWPEILGRYDVVESKLEVGGRQLTLAHVRSINALVDAMGPDDFGPDERLPYWAVLWPAAQALAAELLERSRPLEATVELGSGLGLCAIAAALAGAEVTATDYEPDALAFIRHNAQLNRARLRTHLLDWRHLDLQAGGFHMVIGSDVLYEERQVEPLSAAIDHLTAQDGMAIVSDPGRRQLGMFQASLGARGFTVRARQAGDVTLVEARRGTFTQSPA